jgi:S1-C subfamily serine protease
MAASIEARTPPARRTARRRAAARLCLATLLVLLAVGVHQRDDRTRDRLAEHTSELAADIERISQDLQASSESIARLSARVDRLPVPFNAVEIQRAAASSVFRVEALGMQGSAFVVESSGSTSQLLTSYHVVSDAWSTYRRSIRLTGQDTISVGEIVAVDAEADLALIEVSERWTPLPQASTTPPPGTTVMVLGAPLGLDGTVTIGVLSTSHDGFLQLSAAISPGSSGGPVLDENGHVVGVVAWKFVERGAESLNFAVPVAQACDKVLRCD